MFSFIEINVVMLSIVLLSVVMLSVIMLSVIMLSVVMLTVVAHAQGWSRPLLQDRFRLYRNKLVCFPLPFTSTLV
jgi:hypothetical protein